MKKLLSVFVITAVLLVFSVLLASCGGGDVPTEATTTSDSVGAADTQGDTTTSVPEPELAVIGVTSNVGEYLVSLDWDDVEGADAYEVYASENGGESYTLVSEDYASELSIDNAKWGEEYTFIVKALTGDEVIGESEAHTAKTSGVRVNDFAPADGNMTVYCKKVGSEKSDGFIVIINGDIYIIDSGVKGDAGISNYLMELRTAWLGNQSDTTLLGDGNAKLAINFIITHSHSDHMNAIPAMVQNRFFSIEKVYAPTRAYLSGDVEGALPTLTKCENRIDTLKKEMVSFGHGAGEVIHVPFGEHIQLTLKNSDATLDLYPAVFDWSVTQPSATEGYNLIRSICKNTDLNLTNGILNSNSLWAKFTCGGQVMLFTGDTSDNKFILDTKIKYYGIDEFDCDALHYIHHGQSRYSLYLLEATTPSVTVFTAIADDVDKNAMVSTKKVSDAFCLSDGALTLKFNGETIESSGISPRK